MQALGDFTLEIQCISLWNLVDFTCEIWQISPVKSSQNYKSKCFSKNSSVWWMQGGGYDQGFHEIHPEIQWISPMKSGRFHPDFTCEIHPNYKSKLFQQKLFSCDECRVGDFTLEIWWISTMKSSGFHLWNPRQNYKSKCFSKNSSVWWMQGGGFHPRHPVDFTQIWPVKSTQNYKSKCFSKNSSVWWMQGGGFHPEIWWISPVKSGRFHLWNPPKIIKASVLAKTLQFDECRVGAMTKDFMKFTLKSGGFHPWNLADFTCEIHPNYKSKCFSKNSSVWWMQGGGYDQGFHEIHQISPWNLVDFTCEIWWISPRFDLWNPPKIIKASVFSKKTLQFDECKVGAMTKDFMKSTGFHMKSAWNPPDFMKSTGFSCGFHEIRRISCEIERPLARNCNPMFVILIWCYGGFYKTVTKV